MLRSAVLLVASTWTGTTASVDDELIPAGSVNAAIAARPVLVVHGDHPDVEAQARWAHGRFFADGELVSAADALERDLSGANLVVYGSPEDNAWLQRHAERLPFAFGAGELTVQDRRYQGEHLRLICTVRQPDDAERRAVIYTAARSEDVAGINELFHGPREWLVADGGRTLATGDYRITGPVSVAAMRTDLDVVIRTMLDVHPATAGELPQEVAAAIDRARSAIDEPLERDAFWSVVNRLLLSLDDAHTSLARPGDERGFDLPLRWLGEGLVVSRDTDLLRCGDRVQSLAGLDEVTLLNRLRALIPAENDGWIRHSAERGLAERTTLRWLGLEVSGGLPLVLLRDGETVRVTLPAGRPPAQEERPRWVRFTIEEDASLGVFTLDACRVDDTYRSQLEAFFQAVHESGVQRIAVDLRANGGGNSRVVDEFIRYLDVDEYRSYGGAVRVSEASIAQRGANGAEPGFHEFEGAVHHNARVTSVPPFGGEVFVLTSPATFSSGNWFAVVLGDNGLATILGEPTGNAPSAFGDVLTFALPETNFSFGMSFKRWLRPDPGRDPASTLEPDVRIPLTAADLAAGVDPVLDHLRGLAVDER